jgi:hypothetical protein
MELAQSSPPLRPWTLMVMVYSPVLGLTTPDHASKIRPATATRIAPSKSRHAELDSSSTSEEMQVKLDPLTVC